MLAPFGRVSVTVPEGAGIDFWYYEGKSYCPGATFFVLEGDESCFEASTSQFPCDNKGWPDLCKTVNGAYTVEKPDQANVPAGGFLKITIPTHPDECYGKPGMVLFQPLCAGCFAVSIGDTATPIAEPGEQITDGSAPLSNPTSLSLGGGCNGDQYECFVITNLGDTALPINLLWGK